MMIGKWILILLASLNFLPAEEEPATQKADLGFSIAFGLPYVVATSASQSRDMVVEAIYGATQLSGSAEYGQVTSTGTLLVTDDDAKYLPTPSDRLVVKLKEGTHEFILKNAQGNDQATTATAWLHDPHILHYVHKLPGVGEAEIQERFDGSKFTAAVKGWYQYAGTRFDLHITSSGGSSGTRDYHGQDTQDTYTLTGNINGGGIEVEVDEKHSVQIVAANNLRLLYSQRGSASRFNATLNNVLRQDGKEYKLDNIRVQTDSKTKGGVSSFAVTGLEGKVLKDGQRFGFLSLHEGRAVLKTLEGLIALELPVAKPKSGVKQSK